MKLLNRLDGFLNESFVKSLFDHIRNYMMCALLLAAGFHAYASPNGAFFGLLSYPSTGIGIIVIAILLSAINLYDGIRMLKDTQTSIIVNSIILVIYIFFSIRVIEITMQLRTGI